MRTISSAWLGYRAEQLSSIELKRLSYVGELDNIEAPFTNFVARHKLLMSAEAHGESPLAEASASALCNKLPD